MEMSTPRALSALLEDMGRQFPEEKVRISAILEAFHERGFGILLFLFSLPAALPVPMPGLNSLIAIPLIILTWQQMIGRHTVWMPQKVLNATIERDFLVKIVEGSLPYVKKLEHFIRPRLGWMTQGRFSLLIGLAGLIMAVSGAAPLLLVNTVPAVGITLMAVGVMMRDGLVVLIGMIGGLLWVIGIYAVYILFGMEAIYLFKEYILSWLP